MEEALHSQSQPSRCLRGACMLPPAVHVQLIKLSVDKVILDYKSSYKRSPAEGLILMCISSAGLVVTVVLVV